MSKGAWSRPVSISERDLAIKYALALGPERCKYAATYSGQRFPRCTVKGICKACARKWRAMQYE